jgi:hypothetical protein
MQDFLHVRPEAHIQQLVCLIEHESAQPIEPRLNPIVIRKQVV